MTNEVTNLIKIDAGFDSFGDNHVFVFYDINKRLFTDNGLTMSNCSMSDADCSALRFFLSRSYIDKQTNAVCLVGDYNEENLRQFIRDLNRADSYIKTADCYADHF